MLLNASVDYNESNVLGPMPRPGQQRSRRSGPKVFNAPLAVSNSKQSRQMTTRQEQNGVTLLLETVELISAAPMMYSAENIASGVHEMLACFPSGFTPTLALSRGRGTETAAIILLVRSLCVFVTNGQLPPNTSADTQCACPPSTRLADCRAAYISPLLAIIDRCAIPLVCATLDDQKHAAEALTAITGALTAALAVSYSPLQIAVSRALAHIVGTIRRWSHDDITLPLAQAQNAPPAWRMRTRGALSEDLVRALCDALGNVLGEEEKQIERQREEVEARLKCPDSRQNDDSDSGDEKPVLHSSTEVASAVREVANASESFVATSEVGALLATLREVSTFSEPVRFFVHGLNRCSIVFRGLLRCLPSDSGRGDTRRACIVEIMWNILELDKKAEWEGSAAQHYCTPEALEILYNLLVDCFEHCHKLKERELRNDIMVVLNSIADEWCGLEEELLSLFASFAELLFVLTCGDEMRAVCVHENNALRRAGEGTLEHLVNPHYHYTTSLENQQAKALGWLFLTTLCRKGSDVMTAKILDWGLVDVLLSYVNVDCEFSCIVKWSTSQLVELQEQAWDCLIELGSLPDQRPREHMCKRGAQLIIQKYIAECPDMRLQKQALTALARLAVTEKIEVARIGGIQTALELLQKTNDDALCVECLNMLSDIVDGDEMQQSVFLENGGVEKVLPFLCFMPAYHTIRRDAVVASAVACCWHCLFGNPYAEERFIANDGVHALLCAIQSAPYDRVSFLLSALSDLLLNSVAVTYFRLWRSPTTNRSAVQVFIDLWRSTGEEVDDDGRATSDSRAEGGAPRVLELLGPQLRVQLRIYSCLRSIGFSDHRELSPSERATLAHIEIFEDLLNDLAWSAVVTQVEQDGVTPIPTDKMKLEYVIAEREKRAEALAVIQTAFLEQERSALHAKEVRFYKTLIKKCDEVIPKINVRSGMTITEAKAQKAQMLRQSFQRSQTAQYLKGSENQQEKRTEEIAVIAEKK